MMVENAHMDTNASTNSIIPRKDILTMGTPIPNQGSASHYALRCPVSRIKCSIPIPVNVKLNNVVASRGYPVRRSSAA